MKRCECGHEYGMHTFPLHGIIPYCKVPDCPCTTMPERPKGNIPAPSLDVSTIARDTLVMLERARQNYGTLPAASMYAHAAECVRLVAALDSGEIDSVHHVPDNKGRELWVAKRIAGDGRLHCGRATTLAAFDAVQKLNTGEHEEK